LRQAPKVILVGEMRDRETLEIGLSAAETGHLVMSTLHTVDAGQTINRMLGMFDKGEKTSDIEGLSLDTEYSKPPDPRSRSSRIGPPPKR
jgi:Tfp pilus assembly pilus retraction ATPase PilT